ncbi:PREDICTED: peptidoglycan-recognition protein LE-like [Habropoda laboriosa]|uniref:peptidoglycan-recognition protein LE-like n=1 Tax=Habropoda laboriosa TaxID=597456 RepID=UPI00083DEA46|nr:PREDICTED: peptidoglycan-recognition protein LE-like [Habropoda laboriosa]
MAMVTLVQQHQQTTLDENRCQKEQDQISITTIENSDTENSHGEIVQSQAVKDNTAVTVAGNGSFAGSSTQCSDVEEDNDEDDDTDIEEGEWIPDLPVPAVFQAHQQVITADGNVVLPNADTSNFGDVRVKNSANVHLGNKTFYKGPVTIKQFVYTSPTSIQEPISVVKTNNGQTSSVNTSDLPAAHGDSTANSILSQNSVLIKVTKWLWTWRCASLLCILALILAISVIVASVYTGRDLPVYPEIPSPIPPNGNVRFVPRQEWGGQPPEEPLLPMKLPVPYVIISHTATDFCSTQSACTLHVRFAQTFHIESKHWSDIAYSFLVGGDGLVYVGRGWDKMGAHSFGYNNISIGISFIGTFNTVEPPKIQLVAAQRLIEIGVEEGKIAPNYKLLGHKQVSRTLSPGDKLYSIIQTWPHWSPEP